MTLRIKMLCAAIAFSLLAMWTWGQTRSGSQRAEGGRFQIAAQPGTNDIMGNVFLLDTETGKVWKAIRLQDADGDDNGLGGEPYIWAPMTRLDSRGELNAFYVRHPEKATK